MIEESWDKKNDEVDYEAKIVIVGDSGVGKTNIVRTLWGEKFKERVGTVGSDTRVKVLSVEGKKMKVTIWDTAGQERYKSLAPIYYKDSDGVIFVYDISNRRSLQNLSTNCVILDEWIRQVEEKTSKNTQKILVGNKIDF